MQSKTTIIQVSDNITWSIFKKQHLMDLTDYKTELAR